MRTPISDEVRLLIFKNYAKKEKTSGILGFELGSKPGVILFKTKAGSVPCTITEDETFIYFQMPSGKEDRKVKKRHFLEKITVA